MFVCAVPAPAAACRQLRNAHKPRVPVWFFDISQMPAHSWLWQSPAKAPVTAELAGLLCCPGCHSNCRKSPELQEECSSRDGKIRH